MTNLLNLAAYLDRIHFRAPVARDFQTLAGIVAAHVASIPFENFDVLLKRPIRLDIESLEAKLIGAHRGGYCYEHASLLHAALEAIGFAPRRHASRVIRTQPRHNSARQHLFLTVTLDGATYALDPGFGAFACPHPIPLDGTPIPATAPTHRLARHGSDWILHVADDGAETQGWVSTMEEAYPVDVEMMNHYTATHPASFFTHNILASARTPDGRVNIMNQGARIIRNGTAESIDVPDRKALRALVAAYFGCDLPELETMPVSAVPGWGVRAVHPHKVTDYEPAP